MRSSRSWRRSFARWTSCQPTPDQHEVTPMPRLNFAFALLVVLHGGCVMAAEPGAPTAEPTVSMPLTSPSPSVDPSLSGAPTPDPNVQAGVPSEHGIFVGSWSSDPATPPINELHVWV